MSVNKTQDNSAGAGPKKSARTLGFGTTLGLMGATRGSEYTNSIAKIMQEMYSAMATPPKVHVFDKERLQNLAYSCIVVSLPNAEDEICYHVLLLEATGMEPLKASDIVAEATRAMRDANSSARIFTPSDAINKRLNDIILREVAGQYKSNEFISTDGTVVHMSNLEISDLAMRVAAVAYNAVHTESLMSTGDLADLNVASAIEVNRSSGRNTIKLEYNMYSTTTQNLVGSPTRQDFKVDLTEVSQNSTFELNSDTANRLVSVGGFVDAIREDLPMAQTQIGMAPSYATRLHPNIIVTSNDSISPTQGFMMVGIAAATVMSRPELWLQSLAAIDPKSNNNPGVLNTLTNIENGQSGTALDFSAKKVTTDEHYAALKQMFSLSPVISYDVEVFGPNAHYSSVLASAANQSGGVSSTEARQELIETCIQLTDGNFPMDFNPNNIFATDGIIVPMGYWMDKSGERDIRDIDMAFVANRTGDQAVINKWSMTALPRSVTGLDPFLTKVEVINQLIPDAVINGKAVRITFTNAFITALTTSLEKAGLVARYESSLVLNERYSTGQFADYLSAAGLANAAGFGQQGGGSGNGLYTPYGYMGNFGR